MAEAVTTCFTSMNDVFYRRSQEYWDRHFLDVAEVASRPSKDPSRRVGAVIVDRMRRQIGSGYNGFPRDVLDHPDRFAVKRVKYSLIVHAEANAIHNSTGSVEGCTLYCTSHPCSECTKSILQRGIIRVVCPTVEHLSDYWREDAEFSLLMLGEAGVELITIPHWTPSQVSEDRLR
jgi:dCMP deaminase